MCDSGICFKVVDVFDLGESFGNNTGSATNISKVAMLVCFVFEDPSRFHNSSVGRQVISVNDSPAVEIFELFYFRLHRFDPEGGISSCESLSIGKRFTVLLFASYVSINTSGVESIHNCSAHILLGKRWGVRQ